MVKSLNDGAAAHTTLTELDDQKLFSHGMASIKVDREDHFSHPGFLHIKICVFLGYKASNFTKKLDVIYV